LPSVDSSTPPVIHQHIRRLALLTRVNRCNIPVLANPQLGFDLCIMSIIIIFPNKIALSGI
jgi:hypothetical protein